MTATDAQTAIPVPPEPESGSCGWCGLPAREKLILDQGRTRAANGVMVQKFTKWSWVCDKHSRSLHRRRDT